MWWCENAEFYAFARKLKGGRASARKFIVFMDCYLVSGFYIPRKARGNKKNYLKLIPNKG
uniref:Uncharacterized protein n=1 Tax=Candidatus Kentrum sp. LFY TaxID=2126342 RepID=A0A450UUY7_9GAMM|nr:MAG: hypothetical protein BECKLFY1418B_GA0070995_10844 [Candidatus Kentron sp. LFY]